MAARIPARLWSRQVRSYISHRTFVSTSSQCEAHNFTMPAMSPTMTEGNIASWKVNEGDSFSTGDVLLEIETDKATMDVEAQDDGIMAKILAQDGSKSVQVGTRIAVIADQGDDLSSLEIPAEDSNLVSKPPDTVKKADDEGESKQESKSTPSPDPAGTPPNPRPSRSAPASSPSPSGPGPNTKYPLYPSVITLIHENHLSDADVAKIPATGPQNRLLKGDVLAYLGSINPDYSSKQSTRIEHLSHLDLSNIKIVPAPEKPPVPTTVQPTGPTPIVATDVSLPISLAEVLQVQKRIQDSLGVSMPLSTFLARAVDIANEELPNPKGAKPSADELFDAVLGLDSAATTSRGGYIPQIAAMPVPAPAATGLATRPRTAGHEPDIIDILWGRVSSRMTAVRSGPASRSIAAASPLHSGATNLFTVTVPPGEEKRARTFLERMKTVLQVEPGRLVL